MSIFNITWISRGIIHHTNIEGSTKEEAIKKFYNMAADTAIIIDVK